jgi:hypothetical protein
MKQNSFWRFLAEKWKLMIIPFTVFAIGSYLGIRDIYKGAKRAENIQRVLHRKFADLGYDSTYADALAKEVLEEMKDENLIER